MTPRNQRTTVLLGSLLSLFVLGFSDTAAAQTVTVTGATLGANNTLTFANVPSGGASTQQVQINTDISTTVFINTGGSPSWLRVSPSGFNSVFAGTPLNVNVTANATGLNNGTYQGTFTVGINGSQTPPVTVTANLTVTGSSLFTATPSSMSFTAQQGAQAGNPAGIPVQISSSGQNLNYTLLANQSWILLSTNCAAAGSCITGGPAFTVSVNPSGLAASTTPYQGTITAQSTTTNDAVVINVSLTVNASATLNVTPSTLSPFLYQVGGAAPLSQQLMVTSNGGPVQFTVSVAGQLQNNIQAVPNQGQTGSQPVTVTLSPFNLAGLQPGSYTGTVTVTPLTGTAPPPVNVSLVVTNNPLLSLSNNSVPLSGQFGSTTLLTQTVSVTSTGNPVGFTTSLDPTAPWLTVTPTSGSASSTSAVTLTLQANPTTLAVGNYTGTIIVKPTNGDPYSLPITVSLSITNTSQLSAGPPLVHFSWQTSQSAPGAQLVQILSSGLPVSFTVAAAATTVTANCPANWLSAGPSGTLTTTSTVTVSVQTAGMQPGTCTGSVVVTPVAGSTAQPLTIPVAIDVSNSAELNISLPPGFGVQTVQQGAGASTFLIPLTSTGAPTTQVNFAASANTTWLSVAPSALTSTPQNLQVFVSPATLTPGIYNATILITSASLPSGSISIPYTLTVNPNVTIGASQLVTFNQPQGGPAPQPQTLTLTATGGAANYTAVVTPVTGGNWLKINSGTSASGTINPTATITVSVDSTVSNSLPANPNPYTSQITLAFGNSAATPPITINVNLLVGPSQTLTVTPAPSQTLIFGYQQGGALPATQRITVTASPASPAVAFTVATSSSGWLSVDATQGTTPKDIIVTANPQNVPVGVPQTGTITITSAALATPITYNVTFTVSALPPPQLTTVLNSATNVAGPIAPGELITLKGIGLGPASPAAGTQFTVNAQGGVNSTLAGVQVLFNGNPGTPTFVSAAQVNVIVPYEIAGQTTVNIVVLNQGVPSAAIQQAVVNVSPGIYSWSFNGQGQAVVGNLTGSTAGTFNGPPGGITTAGGQFIATSPATAGSYIYVLGTGGGQTNPPSVTGSVNSTTTLMPLANWTPTSGTVTATIGGQPAVVQFAGAAPGLVTGVVQFNLQVPSGVTGNNLPIVITVNGQPSPTGVTVAVQ